MTFYPKSDLFWHLHWECIRLPTSLLGKLIQVELKQVNKSLNRQRAYKRSFISTGTHRLSEDKWNLYCKLRSMIISNFTKSAQILSILALKITKLLVRPWWGWLTQDVSGGMWSKVWNVELTPRTQRSSQEHTIFFFFERERDNAAANKTRRPKGQPLSSSLFNHKTQLWPDNFLVLRRSNENSRLFCPLAQGKS